MYECFCNESCERVATLLMLLLLQYHIGINFSGALCRSKNIFICGVCVSERGVARGERGEANGKNEFSSFSFLFEEID